MRVGGGGGGGGDDLARPGPFTVDVASACTFCMLDDWATRVFSGYF